MITDQIVMKAMSAMEKCLPDEDLSGHAAVDHFRMFKNERLVFQVGILNETNERYSPLVPVKTAGALAPFAVVKQVMNLPIQYPTLHPGFDTELLREKPCLAPDPIRPLHYRGSLPLPTGIPQVLFVEINVPETMAAGTYDFKLYLGDTEPERSVTVTVDVLADSLPEQKLIHTEWFYTDCIAEAHHVKVFSEKHWKIIESYLRTAVNNGINMILTPVFTQELDTYIGGERLTTQLVKITVTGKDKYAFDFTDLDRWIALCKSCGVKYYEIPHFFTQWGAAHAPKFVAKVNGRTKKIFGWETDAMGKEYGKFLSQLIPALVKALKKNGVDQQCFFHVSDEPQMAHLDHYRACRELLSKYLGDYNIIDALSNVEFYKTGAIAKPVPSIGHIKDFMDLNVPGLWAYYCGCPNVRSARSHLMPSYRTRILGVQLWKANIEGFLHWGYNFYHNRNSYDIVDPFGETSGEFFSSSGDAFLVYPGDDDTAWESLRLTAIRQAMDDMRALDLLAQKKGRAFAEQVLKETAGMEITFFEYPRCNEFFDRLRERIAKEL